ncbi:MAG: peptidase M15 [Alphaproteobacteria bacterium]|nr:peptidase M15 [Alphaproteobacteria bacterium]
MTKNYFSRKEEWCPCCHSGGLVPDFREKLNKAREIAGIPFILNSAYRCEKHNAEVGGTETSAHLAGCAVDIRCNDSRSRWIIIDALIRAGFNRIGIGKSFVHVDDDLTKELALIWVY